MVFPHRRTRKLHSVFLCILGIPVYFSVVFVIYFVLYWTAAVKILRVESESTLFHRYLNHSSEGGLNVHIWLDLCGTHVHRLRQTPLFPRHPHQRFYLHDFKSTPRGVQYGQRIFGFVKPTVSGYYQFAISSDDASELWLSFSEDPTKVRLVASVSSSESSAWTMYGDYGKYPTQISRKLRLQSNTSYYIEAFHKQGEGDGHVGVYWKPPASRLFQIIRRLHLSPFYLDNNSNHTSNLYSNRMPSQTKHNVINISAKNRFLDLQMIDENSVDMILPECSYEPSFIVNRTLKRYEGVYLIQPCSVFPDDDTTFLRTDSPKQLWLSGNELVNETKVHFLVSKFMEALEKRHPKKYLLQKIIRVERTIDQEKGDRFLLELQLGLRAHSEASVSMSRYVFLERGVNELCFPEGYQWHRNANIYFILPVKNQGGWLHHFITEITRLHDKTRDDNFFVIVIDFASDDVDVAGMINSSYIGEKITLIRKSGPFYKTLAINEGVTFVPSARDIVFLFDLHIDVPLNLLDSIRKHTIQGKMAYSPVVGRLECGSFRDDPDAFWQMNGFGIMAVYKSDWDRFGGMNVKDFTTKWGGEDWDLVDRILGSQLEILQLKQRGLLHYYHSHSRMWNDTSR